LWRGKDDRSLNSSLTSAESDKAYLGKLKNKGKSQDQVGKINMNNLFGSLPFHRKPTCLGSPRSSFLRKITAIRIRVILAMGDVTHKLDGTLVEIVDGVEGICVVDGRDVKKGRSTELGPSNQKKEQKERWNSTKKRNKVFFTLRFVTWSTSSPWQISLPFLFDISWFWRGNIVG
jgi:hypothetical protein